MFGCDPEDQQRHRIERWRDGALGEALSEQNAIDREYDARKDDRGGLRQHGCEEKNGDHCPLARSVVPPEAQHSEHGGQLASQFRNPCHRLDLSWVKREDQRREQGDTAVESVVAGGGSSAEAKQFSRDEEDEGYVDEMNREVERVEEPRGVPEIAEKTSEHLEGPPSRVGDRDVQVEVRLGPKRS